MISGIPQTQQSALNVRLRILDNSLMGEVRLRRLCLRSHVAPHKPTESSVNLTQLQRLVRTAPPVTSFGEYTGPPLLISGAHHFCPGATTAATSTHLRPKLETTPRPAVTFDLRTEQTPGVAAGGQNQTPHRELARCDVQRLLHGSIPCGALNSSADPKVGRPSFSVGIGETGCQPQPP